MWVSSRVWVIAQPWIRDGNAVAGREWAQLECGHVRGRAVPQWGHLNHGGRAGTELQPTARWVFALALDTVWWTKTILCQSTCCFGQLIAPEEILNLLL